MNSPISNLRIRNVALVLAAVLASPVIARPTPQAVTASGVREAAARTGVFFRADAPYALRNAEDLYLPIYLEIINGVEKTGQSAVTVVRQYVTRAPLELEGVNIFVKPAGTRRQFASEPLRLGSSQDYSLDTRTEGQPLRIADRMRRVLEIPRERIESYLKQHYIGGPFDVVDLQVSFYVVGWPSQDFYLRVRLDAPPLPAVPNWYRGDMHYHCMFTDNPAERGYLLSVTKQAALHAGFNWVLLADHSSDLDAERFAEALREVRKYRDGRFLFIRGEEVTVASGKEALLTTVHMVAAPSPDNPDKGFSSGTSAAGEDVITTGDGSLASPAMPLEEALRRVAAADGFAYAAHPFDPISPILRGGSWDLERDFLDGKTGKPKAGLVGLQPWNRATTVTADNMRDPFCIRRDADPTTCFQPDREADQYVRLERGIELGWRPLLRRGLSPQESSDDAPAFKFFLAAGSDAHGDLNYEATMDAVDFLSKPSRGIAGYAEDNALGRISTLVYCPEGMGPRGENVLRALREGRSVMSNGPLLIAGFDRNQDGNLDDPEDVLVGQHASFSPQTLLPLQLSWVSSEEFGPLVSLRLVVGSSSGESDPQEIPVPATKALTSGGLHSVDLRGQLGKLGAAWGYVRLEARTRNSAGEDFRCYTNPIWMRVRE